LHLFLVGSACLARALAPERDVLAQARTELVAIGRIAVDLNQAKDRCDLAEQADLLALGSSRWIGLVAEVGVLRLWRDLGVRYRDTG
jgi:hypothetical protein